MQKNRRPKPSRETRRIRRSTRRAVRNIATIGGPINLMADWFAVNATGAPIARAADQMRVTYIAFLAASEAFEAELESVQLTDEG